MQRAQIIGAIAERTAYPAKAVGAVVDELVRVLTEALLDGDAVNVRKLGRFRLARQHRHGGDADDYSVYATFRTSRPLKRLLREADRPYRRRVRALATAMKHAQPAGHELPPGPASVR